MRNETSTQRLHFLAKFFILFLVLFCTQKTFAQYDYEHYVPPFYNGSASGGDIGTHTAVLSTNSSRDVKVYIYQGYDKLLEGPIVISRDSPYEYVFKTPTNNWQGSLTSYPSDYDYHLTVVGAKELNRPLDDQGLRFYSADDPFFVSIRHVSDAQGASLTTKGTYAYGTDFRTGHVYTHEPNGNNYIHRRSHFISIMAVEDTEVTISDIKCSYISIYEQDRYVGGVKDELFLRPIAPTDNITVSLTKGQSYVIGVDFDEGTEADRTNVNAFTNLGTNGWNGMNGTHITSTKPIAVNTGSWTTGERGQDIGFDQIVPIEELRDEYVVMKGKGDDKQERPIVVATKDNTEVYVNGIKRATLVKAGDFVPISNAYNTDGLAFIETKDKEVYVYQSLAGSWDSRHAAQSMSFIPPLSATGIKVVTVPYADFLAKKAVENAEITILTQTGATVEYEKTVGGTTTTATLPSSSATRVGSTEWDCYKITSNVAGNYRFSSNKAINVAWIARNSVIGAGGYYSGFTKEVSKIIPDLDIDVDMELICESYDDDIVVSLKEPLPDFYEWFIDDTETDPYIANGPLTIEAPDVETSYYVIGYYRDPALDIMVNGEFTNGQDFFTTEYNYRETRVDDAGEYSIATSPKSKNSSFENYGALSDGYMFLGYSKNRDEVMYQPDDRQVEDKFNYILKFYGRLAKKNEHFKDQYVDVTINDELVIDNFKIDDVNSWKSISKLWKPKGAKKASIKFINANESGNQSAFTLDSVSFVQAVQDTAIFVAKVVPTYSYDNNGGYPFHFCENQEGTIDVSNGDTSWFNYSWARKNADGDYEDLENNDEFDGVKTHILKFKDAKIKHEGKYKCTISFKEEYADCGATPDSSAEVEYDVLIDKAVVITMEADDEAICFGETTEFEVDVENGSADDIRWYLKHPGEADYRDEIVNVGDEYTLPETLPAGVYTVKSVAVNGCGNVSNELDVEILAAPNLNDITFNDPICMGDEVVLTAVATPETGMDKRFAWYENDIIDIFNVTPIYRFTATEAKKTSIFSVSVSSIYRIGTGIKECQTKDPILSITWDDLNISPNVAIPDLSDASYCEGGSSHSFSVSTTNDDYYTFQWKKDGVDIAGATDPTYIIPNVGMGEAGNYSVTAENSCGETETKDADIDVTQRLVVTDITADKTGPFCSDTDVIFTFDDNGAVNKYQAKGPADVDFRDITLTAGKYTVSITDATEGEWKFKILSNCGADFEKAFHFSKIPDFGTLDMNDIITCAGEAANFSVSISSFSHLSVLTYAWEKDGAPITGDKASLEITNIQNADQGNYKCTVSDQCGRTKTITKTLTIEKVNSPVSAPAQEVCVGAKNIEFLVDYVGDPATTTFEWKHDGTVVGTNQNRYEIADVTAAHAGMYTCKITLACGLETTINRELIVNEHISIAATAETIDICQEEEPIFKVDITGDPSKYTITWEDNAGNPIAGVDDQKQITLAKQSTAGTFTYKAIVTGKCETLTKVFTLNVHEQATVAIVSPVESCSGNIELTATVGDEFNSVSWWKEGVEVTDTDGDDKKLSLLATSADNGTYIVKVDASDHCKDVEASVVLNVTDGIIVNGKSPAVTTVCEGSEVILEVDVDGDVIYNWYKEGAPTTQLSDKANLVVGTSVTTAEAGKYKCELSNGLSCGNQILEFEVVVHTKPVITDQPDDVSLCHGGGNATFTVVATTEGATSYQWYEKDDTELIGKTNATLTVTTPADGAGYYCIVNGADACDEIKSRVANVSLLSPVIIVDHPKDLEIADGADALFTVTVIGEGPFSYQWEESTNGGTTWSDVTAGGNYSIATTTTTSQLTITNALIDPFHENQYRCIVKTRSVCGNKVESNPAVLTLTDVVKIEKHPINNQQVCFNGTFDLTVEGKVNGLTYTWQYSKGGAFMDADGADGMSVSTTGKISTLTIPTDDLAVNTWKFKCIVSDGISTPQESDEVQINILEEIVVNTPDSNFETCLNSTFQINVDATGDNITYSWYKEGDATNILSTNNILSFANIAAGDAGKYICKINNTNNCYPALQREFEIVVRDVPTITKQPVGAVLCKTVGSHVFEIDADSDIAETYQWYKNGAEITGKTNKTYTEKSITNASYYTCRVTNTCGTVESTPAVIATVQELKATNPVDITIPENSTANFEVKASGEPTYSYQWEESTDGGTNWNPISDGANYIGSKTDKLQVIADDKDVFDQYQYRCVVSTSGSICGNIVTTAPAILTVLEVEKITVQPKNIEVCEGTPAIFEVEGKPATSYAYTWQYNKIDNTDAGFIDVVDGTDGLSFRMDGSSKSILTLNPTTLANNSWHFRCLVDNGVVEKSTVVKATVRAKIVASIDDPATPTCANGDLLLSVKTTAGDNLQYKWYKEGDATNILSTALNYTISNIQLLNEGKYICKVYNDSDCPDEDVEFNVDVKINAEITTQPVLAATCEGDDVTATIAGTTEGTTTYTWYDKDDNVIAGATTDQLTVTANNDGEYYYCVISDGDCASATSNVAALTVNRNATITKQPTDKTISDGDAVSFSVDAIGFDPITYQWEKSSDGITWSGVTNGGVYSGADTKVLVIDPAKMADLDGVQFRCKVENTCHFVNSDEVTLTIKPLIKIATHPNNIQACIGLSEEFEIIGTSDGLAYEWEYKIGAGAYNTVTGVTELEVTTNTKGSKLKIKAATAAMANWSFRCLVNDGVSTPQISNEVSVTLFNQVTFDEIDDQDLCFGITKQLQVTNLAGDGPFIYEWTKDGEATPLSTSTNLDLPADANGDYHVSVSNAVCPVVTKDFTVTHHKELELAAWSNTDKVCIGTPTNLGVVINQKATLPGVTPTFTWEKDGVDLGETSDSYTVPAIDKTEIGQYAVSVSDGCSTEKISGFVNVYQPISTTDNLTPDRIDICLNDELKLTTNVSGDIVSYVWKHEAEDGTITNLTETGNTFIISNVVVASGGTYTCEVSGECGTPILYIFTVEIVQIPEITTGLDDSDICQGQPLSIGSIIVNPATRIETIEWDMPAGVTATKEDGDKRLNLGVADVIEEGYYMVTVRNMCGEDMSLKEQIVNPTPTLAGLADQIACEGEDVTFEAVTTGRNLTYKWFVNGVEETETSNRYTFTNVLPEDATTPKVITIKCEVESTDGCTPTLETEATLTVNPSTVLTSTIPNQTVYVGNVHTISVDATGLGLNYVWKHEALDGTITTLTGETGSFIFFDKIEKADEGFYHCEITGACGVRSASGKLTVKELIIIDTPLSDRVEKCEGEQLDLTTNVSGEVKAVAWFKVEGGVEKDLGVTSLSYKVDALSPDDAGEYICRISGEGIDDIVQTCLVRVSKITVLNEPLGNLEICENEPLDWEANVTGDASNVFKWYFNGGTTAIETGRYFEIDNLALTDEGEYEVQITGKCGDVSSKGHVNVVELPRFVKISDELLDICEDTDEVKFTAEFTGENLTYQWYKEGVAITGATKTELVISNVKVTDAGTYHCTAHSENGCGDVVTPTRRLTVTPKLQILLEPFDRVVCEKEDVEFTITALGSGVNYQWKKNGVDITGAIAANYQITGAGVADAAYYTCVVSDRCTAAMNSRPAELVVNRLPDSDILGRLILCAKEDRVTYSTILIPDIDYTWEVAGGIFEGPEVGERTRVTWGEAAAGELVLQVVNDGTGCKSEVREDVVLNPLPTVSIDDYDSKGLCEEKFTLAGGFPAGGIYWIDGISEEEFDPAERGSGTYDVKYSYTDENGCSNVTDVKTLQIDALPVVDITDDTTIGSCTSFQLSAATSEDNVKWYEKKNGSLQLAEDLDDNTSMTPTFTPTNSKVFVAKVEDEHGCTGVDLVNITVAPLPEITTIADTVVGQCNELQLLTDIVGDAGTITWSNADHLDDASIRSPKLVNAPDGTHVYEIDVVDLYGCKASGKVTVEVHEDPVLPEDRTGCEGEEFVIDTRGMSNPVWNDRYEEVDRTIAKAGEYILSVSNEYGCGDEQTFTMDPLPAITMKDTAIIFEGQTLTLSNNFPIKYGPYSYDWKVNQEEETVSIMPTYTVDETGFYTLTVTDHLGCTSTKTTEVTVKPIGIESPTAFTPLAGGAFKNDRFYLKEINVVETFEMFIYNRWGELVYKTKEVGYDGGWNGTYKGQLCPTGAYVWVVFINGEKTNNGTFMLLR